MREMFKKTFLCDYDLPHFLIHFLIRYSAFLAQKAQRPCVYLCYFLSCSSFQFVIRIRQWPPIELQASSMVWYFGWQCVYAKPRVIVQFTHCLCIWTVWLPVWRSDAALNTHTHIHIHTQTTVSDGTSPETSLEGWIRAGFRCFDEHPGVPAERYQLDAA